MIQTVRDVEMLLAHLDSTLQLGKSSHRIECKPACFHSGVVQPSLGVLYECGFASRPSPLVALLAPAELCLIHTSTRRCLFDVPAFDR